MLDSISAHSEISSINLICALGLRFPSLRWEDVSDLISVSERADEFVQTARRKNEWGFSVTASLSKIPNPSRAIQNAEKDLAQLTEIGARWLTPISADYPELLSMLHEKPIILTYFGNPFWKKMKSISIVGSRFARQEVLRWMDHELPVIARSGIAFVSGGARGVDQKAHSVALRCETPTGVILPSGLSALYPAELKSWRDDVVAGGGALLSEFAPDLEMRKHHFHQRNRLVAGFSTVTLIAQCGSKSGTWITAMRALANGRELGVIPGTPWDAQFAGSLDLLADGAHIVRTSEDIFTMMKQWSWQR